MPSSSSSSSSGLATLFEHAHARPGIPTIDAHSAALAAASLRFADGAASAPTRLFKDAARLKELKAHLQELASAEVGSHQPTISRKAAALVRGGAVGDRLYEEAKRQEERREKLRQAAAEELSAQLRADSIHSPEARSAAAGRGAFRAATAGAAGAAAPAAPLTGPRRSTEDLYKFAATLESRKAMLRQEVEKERKKESNPKINE
jgi:hypothetical protein